MRQVNMKALYTQHILLATFLC